LKYRKAQTREGSCRKFVFD
jgi:hypothetical protein